MQCPVSFTPYGTGCIRSCPTAQGFDQTTDGGQPKCVYRRTPSLFVNLTTVTGIPYNTATTPPPIPTLEQLRTLDPGRHALFKQEVDRVSVELADRLTQVSKNAQLTSAFEMLQKAENVRDTQPEAYQRARVSYYSLLRGPAWVETERERVERTDVVPEIARYQQAYQDIESRRSAQQRIQDVMTSVKSGVLSLKDDIQYTTTLFKDQLDELKNQIQQERRGRATPEGPPESSWAEFALNVAILIGLVIAAGLIIWKVYGKVVSPATAFPSPIPRLAV